MDAIKSKPSNLNTFIQNFPFGIVIQNTSGEVISANAEAQMILNLSLDQMRGKKSVDPHWKAIREDGSPFPKEELPGMISLKTGKIVKGVIMGVLHPDLSSYKWLEIYAVPQFIPKTKIISQVYSVFRDITEKINLEQSLKESERTFSSFLNNLPGMAYRCKIDDQWTMLFVSKGCKELTGYHPENFIENREIAYNDIIHPDDRKYVYDSVFNAIEKNKRFVIEYRIITAQDKIRFVIEKGKAVYADNTPLFLEGYIEDITKQKEAEQKLKEKEEALASSINAVAFTDLKGNVTWVNKSFLKLWEFQNLNDVIGKQAATFWNSPMEAKKIIDAVSEKGRWQGKLTGIKNNGKAFHILLSANLVFDSAGSPSKIMASFTDITREKELKDNLKQKLKTEKIISEISSRFIGFFHLDDAINDSLLKIGKLRKASRVYVFLLSKDGKFMDNTHEWCAHGVTPQINSLKHIPVSIFPWWMSKLENQEIIKINNVDKMPLEAAAEKEILKIQDIKSLLVFPINIQDKLRGFVGFDFTEKIRKWSNEDLTLLGMARNILSNAFARNETEMKLVESERKFRHLFEKHNAAKVLLNAETGDIIDANVAASGLLGWSVDELVKMNISQLSTLHPDTIEADFQQINLNKNYHAVVESHVKGGKKIFIEIFSSLAIVDGKNIIHTILFDVSEKVKIQNTLNLIRTAVEQSPESILITNMNGEIIYANPFLFFVTGYSKNEIIGEKTSLFKSGFHDIAFYKNLWETILSNKKWHGEMLNKKKNGDLYWEEVSISPILDSNKKITHFVAIRQDITEKKNNQAELVIAKEKAEESDRIKSAFLATISHELRTPLNAIIGLSDIICDLEKGNKTAEFAKIVYNSGLNLLEIIEDIFSLSLFNDEKIKLRLNAFVVNTLYHNLKKQLKEILFQSGKEHSIELLFTTEQDILGKNIIADIGKINQVMQNLMKNAIKFTDEGTVELGISMMGKNKITLFVKDTGIGISGEQQKYIFDLFRQGDDSHTRKYGGLGIGLAISKRLADAMNGDLSCTSSPGKGSLFSFTFPFETAPKGFNQYAVSYSEIAPSLTNSTILIVEDDPASLLLTRKHLVFTGAKILKAENGKVAVGLVESNSKIDLVLMDIRMPVLDGYEATKAIKAINSQIPVIALTSYSFEEEKQKILRAGCDDIITKPVNKKRLFELLSIYLKN